VGLTRTKRGWKETFVLDDSLSGNTVTLNFYCDRIPAPVVHLLAFGFQGCGRVS
jgi:hypothetical protein